MILILQRQQNQTQQSYYNESDHGNYQFTSLDDIINQFMFIYVGEDKIIPKIKRVDVAFHAQRAMQELSFDTFKSCKAQEITVPASLQMILPQDYVNYTKISWVDSAGIKHLLYPTSKTSNPSSNPLQDSNGDFTLQAVGHVDDDSDLAGVVVLDKEYKDITFGMMVSGPYINPGLRVISVTNSSGITTITIGTIVGQVYTPVIPLDSIEDVTLTFSNSDGSLILPQKSSFIVEDLDWNTSDFKIYFNSLADITDIEVGMLIHHEDFPSGTFVEGVNTTGLEIKVSQLPTVAVTSNAGEITFIPPEKVDTTTWSNYKSGTPSENQDDYIDDTYWPADGSRFGLDPQHAQANGSYYIDCMSGKIHFSSNIAGKTVVLDYISDSLGTDGEMQVHKFAEEAVYKWISHAVLASKANTPEYLVARYKKERFAAIRTAKLRLSNIKLEEITQILRGKSKQIKH